MKTLIAVALIVSTPNPREQAMQAMERGDYRTTAEIFESIAHADNTDDRYTSALPAANAYMFAYERQEDERAVCDGIELLQWYFAETHDPYEPMVALYWRFVAIARERSTCGVGKQPVLLTPRDPVVPASLATRDTSKSEPEQTPVAAPVNPDPVAIDEHPATGDRRRLTIAGAVLTGIAGVGVGALVGEGVELRRRYIEYDAQPADDERLYERGKAIERWMITTGVVSCAALVSGVALLAVARKRKNKITVSPSLGGFTLQARF